eukprot:7013535-Prymnesium_polylepis.1
MSYLHPSDRFLSPQSLLYEAGPYWLALPSPPPGAVPVACRPHRAQGAGSIGYVTGAAAPASAQRFSAPGFAVSGDGGVDPGALRQAHRACRP